MTQTLYGPLSRLPFVPVMPPLFFKPTLLGRSLLLATSEVVANAICWIVAGIAFGRNRDTQPILSLALLAWTLGLRHALDADHIRSEVALGVDFEYVEAHSQRYSAIDNATRGLISLGQLPVTCGLFFSLGHSTIVIVVQTAAIAISSDVFDKMHHVGEVGGIVGAAVSGSFLFIVGLANTVILWRILKQRWRGKIRRKRLARGESVTLADPEAEPQHNHMLMMRILGPMMKFVNRPWKMYPVGVLFGFGFDTASSIALLALSAIAKRGSDGKSIPSAQVIILPLLFTAGMSLIDSLDSILMLYSYSGIPEHSCGLFERRHQRQPQSGAAHMNENLASQEQGHEADGIVEAIVPKIPHKGEEVAPPEPGSANLKAVNAAVTVEGDIDSKVTRDRVVKMNVMSMLSIILTLMSILVAFSISLITIMGLIGDQCRKCRGAAEADDGGALAGSWWRAWARANDNSGYIGAAIGRGKKLNLKVIVF
ncbi:NicO-domain-containing protein [Lyophyllum atratum]|nr:NicO-domain-containing protein [Lyophyllum atratum]